MEALKASIGAAGKKRTASRKGSSRSRKRQKQAA
jgi:hypothetical protein